MGNCCIKGRPRNFIGSSSQEMLTKSCIKGSKHTQNFNNNIRNKMSSSEESCSLSMSMSASPSPLQINLPRLDSMEMQDDSDDRNVKKVRFHSDGASSIESEPFISPVNAHYKRLSLKSRVSAPFLTVPTTHVPHHSKAKVRPNKLFKATSDLSTRSTSNPTSTLCVSSIFQSEDFVSNIFKNASSPEYPPLTPGQSTVAHTMLADREDEFIIKEEITVFCITWNCYGKVSVFIN